MADGAYERRGLREAELAKFRRIIAETASHRSEELDNTNKTNSKKEV